MELRQKSTLRGMTFRRNLFIVCLSLSLLHLVCRSKGEYCAPMTCSDTQTSIEFPFRIKERQPNSCGSPGFDVSCDKKRNTTLLELPSAGNFRVEQIPYCSQEIQLSDPDDCLPKKLLTLNLNNITSFRLPERYEVLSLYNCSGMYWNYFVYDIIYCLSEFGYTVISEKDGIAVHIPECTFLKNISAFDYHYTSLGRINTINLAWDVPHSQTCRTDFSPSAPYGVDKPGWRIAAGIISAIALGLGLPALAIILCLCRTRQSQRNQPSTNNSSTSNETSTTVRGLDQNIIDLYPVMIVGDTGYRLTSEDVMCSICLSDYAPQDKLKVLPECLHRFHADCIDEWLRAKPTCPVCRIIPPSTAPTL